MRRAVRVLHLVWATALALAIVGSSTLVAVAEPLTRNEPATTTLTLQAPKVIRAHEVTVVVATLESTAGAPVPRVPVAIVRIASSAETTVATGLTNSDGRFVAKVSPTSRIVLQARFSGDVAYLASESSAAAVTPKVELARPWTHDDFAYPGQWLPARGSLWPAHSRKSTSTRIVCERKQSGRWVVRRTFKAAIVTKNGKSRYVGKFQLPTTGTWRVRILHDDAGHARTLSQSRSIKVTNWPGRYRGHKIGGFKTKRKLVALTFDDGPNARTLAICRILEKYDAKGTFFFVDQLFKRGYEKQAKAAYDRGHEIANHTAHHKMLYGYAESLREATPAQRRIKKATGFAPIWIRGMGGGIDSAGLRAVGHTGQLYCNWSVDSYDSHQLYLPPDTIYRIVMKAAGRGDVILLHQTHPESIQALPRICAELKRRGYKMVTLSKLASETKGYTPTF